MTPGPHLAASNPGKPEGSFLGPNVGMDLDDGDRELLGHFTRTLPPSLYRELWVAMLDQALRDLHDPKERRRTLAWFRSEKPALSFRAIAEAMGCSDGEIDAIRKRVRKLKSHKGRKVRYASRHAARRLPSGMHANSKGRRP